MIDYHKYQAYPAKTEISKSHLYLSPHEAAVIGGAKFDEKKLRELMNQ